MNKRPKVLIAEDEETIVESLSFLMEKEGYDVSVATDGQTAIKMITRDIPDMVLLDVMMPGCDGFEVVRAVRADPKTCLLYTSDAADE